MHFLACPGGFQEQLTSCADFWYAGLLQHERQGLWRAVRLQRIGGRCRLVKVAYRLVLKLCVGRQAHAGPVCSCVAGLQAALDTQDQFIGVHSRHVLSHAEINTCSSSTLVFRCRRILHRCGFCMLCTFVHCSARGVVTSAMTEFCWSWIHNSALPVRRRQDSPAIR